MVFGGGLARFFRVIPQVLDFPGQRVRALWLDKKTVFSVGWDFRRQPVCFFSRLLQLTAHAFSLFKSNSYRRYLFIYAEIIFSLCRCRGRRS